MIRGMERLRERLEAYAADLGQAVSGEMLSIARETAELAREAAPEGQPPRDEPRLKDCFYAEGGYLTARALVTNPHAAYVEFGTGQRGAAGGRYPGGYDGEWPGMSAQPYMYPAAQTMRLTYAQRLCQAGRMA
jgi:hypothetical protein